MAQQIPTWAKKYFDEECTSRIEQKITDIELHTRGEVVAMIAPGSSTVGHVPFSLFVTLLLVFTLIDLPHIQASMSGDIWWPILFWPLLCLLLTRLLSPLEVVQRLFLPKEDRQRQVEMRAEAEFYLHNLQKTDGSTGILIFISLLEHQAVVLGDKSIASKLPAETWNHILNDLMEGARKAKLSEGLLTALDDVGRILKEHFPAGEKNPNQLANHLIFVSD